MLFNLNEPTVSRRILFWDGEKNEKLTGGWQALIISQNATDIRGATFNDDDMLLTPAQDCPAIAGTVNLINVDKVKKIHVKIDWEARNATQKSYVGIARKSTYQSLIYPDRVISKVAEVKVSDVLDEDNVATIDVSGITGDYIVFAHVKEGLAASVAPTLAISRIWTE